MSKIDRPISPHLTIYKPQITSVLSIMHRISGFFIYLGVLLLSWVIISAAFVDVVFSQAFLNLMVTIFASALGKALLFLWILALNYHAVNGVRHLVWDMGVGFSKEAVVKSGVIAVVAAFFLAMVSWLLIFKIIFSYV